MAVSRGGTPQFLIPGAAQLLRLTLVVQRLQTLPMIGNWRWPDDDGRIVSTCGEREFRVRRKVGKKLRHEARSGCATRAGNEIYRSTRGTTNATDTLTDIHLYEGEFMNGKHAI